MNRARREEKKHTGGPGSVSKSRRLEIRRRLRKIMKGMKHQAFADALGVSRNTVSTWVSTKPETADPRPPIPETGHLLAIGEEIQIQPTFVLFGVGPERMGAPCPDEKATELLHNYVNGVLASECKTTPEFVASVLPPAADLLAELLDRYRRRVQQEVKAQRAFKRSTSLLERALQESGVVDTETEALKFALLRWETEQDRLRRAKPPVDPPLTPEEFGAKCMVPGVGPFTCSRKPRK